MCRLETQLLDEDFDFEQFLISMYESGEHYQIFRQTALMCRLLPYGATESLSHFFDSLGTYLKFNSNNSTVLQLAFKQLSLLQTGLFQLNLMARKTLLRYISSILMTYEQWCKLLKPKKRQLGAGPPVFPRPLVLLIGSQHITPEDFNRFIPKAVFL